MSASANASVPTIAWDPKSPATLLLPSVPDSDSNNVGAAEKKSSEPVLNEMVCDTGLGCNTFESSAIMNLLDARDSYLDEQKTSSTNDAQALCRLSKEYRKALENCIDDWSEDLEKRDGELEEKEKADDLIHLDLLRATYAVAHLSEIFLLVPNSQQNYTGMIDNVGYGYESDMWNLPGGVTAEMVRYLRKHHFGDINNLFDPSDVEGMYELYQPDQHGDSNGNMYWEMIEALITWGCLEDAWVLLSRHSIVRRFVEMEEQQEQMLQDNYDSAFNDYQTASLAEDREGFRALMSILKSAPLPGFRNNTYDDGFDSSEGENNNEHPPEMEGEHIEGIPTSAYRLWETSSGTGDSHGRTGDYYASFEPKAANMVHRHWKQAIDTLPPLQRLRQRIPQLNKLLCLLAGNFRDIEFNSWQEELCAELLYKNPNIRLMDINGRAAALVAEHARSSMDDDNEGKSPIDTMLLNVMKGNAGEVLKALYEFGGGSGAALPAVMTSLLSQLLGDANLVKDATDTELLVGASSSVRSSLANEGHHDLGTRLAVRLLLPHIQIDSDLRITATLVNTLEHHSPNSDSEAKGLLSLCRNLIERKNVRVLDGCSSICLARYRHYMEKHIPGGAIHWLLTGIELESLVLCEGPKRSGYWQRALSSGVCYRRLVLDFTQTARSLLKTCLGEEEGASLYYVRGKEMVAVTKEELSIENFVPAVKLLENVVAIAGGIQQKADFTIVANSIVACLEERANDEDDGVVSSIARSFSWDLLRLAVEILDMDAEKYDLREPWDNEKSISSFDVRGMGVLLSVLTIEIKAQSMKEQSETGASSLDEEELHRMRLIVGEGLKRAFLAENAMKRTSKGKRSKASGGMMYTANYHKHSREEQERAVQTLLDY